MILPASKHWRAAATFQKAAFQRSLENGRQSDNACGREEGEESRSVLHAGRRGGARTRHRDRGKIILPPFRMYQERDYVKCEPPVVSRAAGAVRGPLAFVQVRPRDVTARHSGFPAPPRG